LCSGGQYTNTGKRAQEKHFSFWVPRLIVSHSVARTAFYEFIQQKPGQPLLVVPNDPTVV
jgi:hypothetical protein